MYVKSKYHKDIGKTNTTTCRACGQRGKLRYYNYEDHVIFKCQKCHKSITVKKFRQRLGKTSRKNQTKHRKTYK